MEVKKRVALVAHDNMKDDLLQWVKKNRQALLEHELFATGTTGTLVGDALQHPVHSFQSGPLGGDQQIGAKIAQSELDVLIFFWDPLEAQPHDPDVRALLRLSVVWNIPVATNMATADFIFSSPYMNQPYERTVPDYGQYRQRFSGK